MNLAKYSLDNTKIVYFFLAVLLIGGVFSFGRLGKKEDAPFVIKTAVIMTRYPGAEPAEVERLITEPISREIQSMSGVYKIKSESMYGLSKITFELQPSLSAASIPQNGMSCAVRFSTYSPNFRQELPHRQYRTTSAMYSGFITVWLATMVSLTKRCATGQSVSRPKSSLPTVL